MPAPFEILLDPIESLAVDAIVVAVEGDASIKIGEALIAPGGATSARFITQVAAPAWGAGDEGERVKGLARCYSAAIKMAASRKFETLALPCLGFSTGWPRGFACAIAVAACEEALAEAPSIKRLIICCATMEDAELYRVALSDNG